MPVFDLIRVPYRLARNVWQTLRYSANSQVLKNPLAARKHQNLSAELTAVQRRMVDDLRTTGIAMVGFDELFGARSADLLPPFRAAVEAFTNGDYVRDEAENYRRNFAELSGKDYVIRYYRKQRERTADDPIFALGLTDELLNPVNAYAGMWMTYRGNDVWYTVPVAVERERKTSQNWHRDYEDEKLVKVFLYCSEVTPRTGPFEYVPKSRRGEKYLLNPALASGVVKDGFYPEPATVDSTIPESARVVCTCPAYTFVFCDTSGLHRGGFAYDAARIVATWMYVTPASLCERAFDVPAVLPPQLSPAALFSVREFDA